MKIFLDTANLDDIRKYNDMGLLRRHYNKPLSFSQKKVEILTSSDGRN